MVFEINNIGPEPLASLIALGSTADTVEMKLYLFAFTLALYIQQKYVLTLQR